MTGPTPAALHTSRDCLIVLERVLRAAAPQEGCALLLGQRQGTVLVLEQIWPCLNSWLPASERQQRFLIDPREQLLAQRWARQRRVLVIGAAHSHPSSAALPSRSDLSLCCGPTLMLIRSGLHDREFSADNAPAGPADQALILPLRAWWIPEGAGWTGDAGPEVRCARGAPSSQELAIALTHHQRAGDLGE